MRGLRCPYTRYLSDLYPLGETHQFYIMEVWAEIVSSELHVDRLLKGLSNKSSRVIGIDDAVPHDKIKLAAPNIAKDIRSP